MDYPFTFAANDETFIGYTLPGSARLRIFRARDDTFLVAFDPEIDLHQHKVTGGMWSNIDRTTDLTLLPALAPQVLSVCDARYQALRDIKTGDGTKPVRERHVRGKDGFDSDYFID